MKYKAGDRYRGSGKCRLALVNQILNNYYKIMEYKTRKYKIDEYLLTLNIKEYKEAMHKLPELLGVCVNTFNNYRKIELGDMQDIPYMKVVMLEKLFDLEPGSLMNYKFETTRFKDLIKVKANGKKSIKPASLINID